MFSSKTTLRDMELIRRAFSELINDPSRLPVSYKLDGIGYHGFPEALKVKTERRLIDANIVERTYSANIPDTALTLRVEVHLSTRIFRYMNGRHILKITATGNQRLYQTSSE